MDIRIAVAIGNRGLRDGIRKEGYRLGRNGLFVKGIPTRSRAVAVVIRLNRPVKSLNCRDIHKIRSSYHKLVLISRHHHIVLYALEHNCGDQSIDLNSQRLGGILNLQLTVFHHHKGTL